MKKFLDILIIVLLTFLIINLFTNDDQKNLSWELVFQATDSKYSIPAEVWLTIKNNTAEAVIFNSCDTVSITRLGESVLSDTTVCQDVSVAAGEEDTLSYATEYESFLKTGQYVFEINYNDKKYLEVFQVNYKGTFAKIFTGLLYDPIYNMIIGITKAFGGLLGWGIIFITIIIRIILLYPQHKMMVSQKKLQAVQPKIKEIQEKYKWDNQTLGLKMMELYKKEKVNPIGSCGFLLIQMPILLVLYHVILQIQDPSNAYHLYSFLSDYDISSISYNFFWVDLLGAGWMTGVILALVVALIQFIQVKLSLANNPANKKTPVVLEKKKDDTSYNAMMPDQDMINKFMLYGMPAMVAVFTFTLIAGVGIYWWMSTLFMIFQQLFVNKILKK